jgi:hypothetical protein
VVFAKRIEDATSAYETLRKVAKVCIWKPWRPGRKPLISPSVRVGKSSCDCIKARSDDSRCQNIGDLFGPVLALARSKNYGSAEIVPDPQNYRLLYDSQLALQSLPHAVMRAMHCKCSGSTKLDTQQDFEKWCSNLCKCEHCCELFFARQCAACFRHSNRLGFARRMSSMWFTKTRDRSKGHNSPPLLSSAPTAAECTEKLYPIS